MDGTIGQLHAFCIIGIHLTLGLVSIWTDTTTWYDGICATSLLLPAIVATVSGRCGPPKLRTTVTVVCIISAVLCQELARHPGTQEWFPFSRPRYTAAAVCITFWLKGASTYVKLWPSIKVMTDTDPQRQADWRDYAGWAVSLLSDFYFLREPHIYLNAQLRRQWRLKFAQMEMLHLSGMALSASSHFSIRQMPLLLLSVIQPLVSFYVYDQAVTMYGTS